MAQDTPIIGFRQDRIGARLICLLNVMRLSRKYGVRGRFQWLSQPDGPYPELVDPRDFLTGAFVAQHIDIVSTAPDRSGLRNLRAVAGGMNGEGFLRDLAQGQRYECDAMSEIVRFMDEPLATVTDEMRQVAQDLALTPRLSDALQSARAIVARAGGGEPIAIHVRRGDILDGDPWSYSSWASKYVPDEFFRAFIGARSGPVIAFSDTPAAVAHLAQGDPRVLAVDDLLDRGALSAAERDLLELLLMAGCAEVGAPSHSAFSRAASVIGGCRILPLPAGLPDDLRRAGYDAVLDRVITRPDSFFAPGDRAQSVSYAARHAVVPGRGRDLVDALADDTAFLERFPFVYRELATAAWQAGRPQKARRMALRGLASPLMRNRDKPICRQILLMVPARTEVPAPVDADFLAMILTGRNADGPIMPSLGHRLMLAQGLAAQAMGFSPALVAPYAQVDADGQDGKSSLPLWVMRLDWSEFIRDAGLRSEMLNWPDLWRKMQPAAQGLDVLEAALSGGQEPARPGDADLARFGFCAAILRLHGRLKRSFAILHWLDAIRPGDMLTHKRLADACFHAGNAKAGWRWLGSAQALAPGNALLRLSQAVRAAEQGDHDAARQHELAATALWPELRLERSIRRAGRDHLPAKA